ncbi:CotS family spore coat protein [Clostridium estertheticum]|uniref:CotS family spore coat protein n=1 Tax=Clostridium estertheticum TaxID=238834 RepID=UPI001CD0D284|nr:CotS family spore coat protein [Clostridium estertheticum]MBZ9687868.1 CotS family spore coat protein [Clostridium estertheticum]
MKGSTRTVERFKIITNKEMQILITVMHKYNIQLVSAEKVRGTYKVTTDIGDFCLKRIRHGRNKAKNGCILAEELIFNKFSNIAKYFRTREGAFYVRYKSNIFYLTEWLEGCECDLTDIDEAVNCTKLLAQFHNISNKIDHNKIHLEKKLKNWPKVFSNNLSNLEKFKKMIISKRVKNNFDVIFLEGIDNFYNRGLKAINMLNKSQYYTLLKVSNDEKTICHNSFYYQNIIKKEGEYFITGLDSIKIDLQISDLVTLIRRLMFKKSYGWDFNFAKALIEAYNSINRLSKEDLEIMFALIIFPQKFWKLGYRRYINRKKWSESKYLHKLNKIISYNENQEKFFEDYLIFLEEYI